MRSTLIRFTKNEYAREFLEGHLYLSSLATFWNIENNFEDQKDVCEGIAATVEKTALPVETALQSVTAFDVRCRLEAYGYCKLLCFFRVDADFGIIELPRKEMNDFGDTVIIIKDEKEFIQRILQAVRRSGGECITGDVRYHMPVDSTRPDFRPVHTITLASSGENGVIPMQRLLNIAKTVTKFGCLDKSIGYANQKEWRICYLPQKNDTEPGRLEIGDLSDVAELVPVSELRKKLLQMNPFHIPGTLNIKRTNSRGTLHYKEFKEKVEQIDGKCRILLDIG